MGETYLWVDSLCIIQDEQDPANTSNISHMGQIYGTAVFTIVAGDSKHADEGLIGINTDREVSEQLTTKLEGRAEFFLPIDMPQEFVPWESRAWTFQEKVFSRRMLIISSGYAVWRCRGAIWREDVNALDANVSEFPWPKLTTPPDDSEHGDDSGLQHLEDDDSVRLMRSHAFSQYSKIAENFSDRVISEPWKIMDAFDGLRRVLELPEMLNSSLWWGLPTRNIHSALLWQPCEPTVRRRPKKDANGNVIRLSPPSWSWGGWASTEMSSKGAKIGFETPFNVRADENGLLMRPDPLGEERIRPLRNIYGVEIVAMPSNDPTTSKLVELGILNGTAMPNQLSLDWEAFQPIQNLSQEFQPGVSQLLDLDISGLNDRHLVFDTQVASIWLGGDTYKVRVQTKLNETEYIREIVQHYNPFQIPTDDWPDLKPILSVSKERQILDTTARVVGTMKLNSGEELVGDVCQGMTAMILSEAQYMGSEKRVDVLGYSVYNIMVIEKQPNGHYQRLGLGKIYKSAWKKLNAERQIIVLE
jgi:hypothetical protein